jgi:hypothetical protein
MSPDEAVEALYHGAKITYNGRPVRSIVKVRLLARWHVTFDDHREFADDDTYVLSDAEFEEEDD